MARGLAIVIGDDWEAQLQSHSIYSDDGTERAGHFDWYELANIVDVKVGKARSSNWFLRLLGQRYASQAHRSQLDLTDLAEHFSFVVVIGSQWKEPYTFEEAQRLIADAPGDPLLTAVHYHL